MDTALYTPRENQRFLCATVLHYTLEKHIHDREKYLEASFREGKWDKVEEKGSEATERRVSLRHV